LSSPQLCHWSSLSESEFLSCLLGMGLWGGLV
jgi:hypothetical protein